MWYEVCLMGGHNDDIRRANWIWLDPKRYPQYQRSNITFFERNEDISFCTAEVKKRFGWGNRRGERTSAAIRQLRSRWRHCGNAAKLYVRGLGDGKRLSDAAPRLQELSPFSSAVWLGVGADRNTDALRTRYGKIQSIFWDIPPARKDPSVNELVRKLQLGILINDRGMIRGTMTRRNVKHPKTENSAAWRRRYSRLAGRRGD